MIYIPVVMATDNRYIPLVVSLTSLLKSAAETTFYYIYILIDDLFRTESEEAVKRSLKVFEDRCTISFVNVGNVFDRAPVSIPHITRPTYFRLMIPELLQEERCIYLDTDTVILSDLQELMNISIEEKYVAGVWHPGVVLVRWGEEVCKNARVPAADQYINAGVLLMNLDMMRRDGLTEKFMQLLPENMPTQDQDILNHVCYGKIAFLPFKYNVLTVFADRCMEDYEGCYPEAELEEAWNKPSIIHYANPNKPWNSLDCAFTDQWWKFFMRTPFYETNIDAFFDEFILSSIYCPSTEEKFRRKMPALYQWRKKRYVIYGAGKRARDVILYMRQNHITPEFVVVSDLTGNPAKLEGIEVKDIKDPNLILEDKTILIAVGRDIQGEILRRLRKYEWHELLTISDEFAIL